MKIKKITSIILALVILLTCSACQENSVEGVVTSLFKALKTYDPDGISKIVTEFPNTDDCGVNYDLFSDEAYVTLFRTAYGNLSYTINSITKNENAATVALTMTHPDFKSSYSTALYSVTALMLTDEKLYNQVMSDQEANISYLVPQQMKNMYLSKNIETITTDFTLELIKENDTWKIKTDNQLKNLMSCNLYTITSRIASGGGLTE